MDLTHILEQAAAGLGSGLGIRCADDGCRGFKDDSQVSGLSDKTDYNANTKNRRTGCKQVWGELGWT